MSTTFHCHDCDENVEIGSALNLRPLCLTCGATLSPVPASIISAHSATERIAISSLEDLFELFGADIQDSIREVMEQSKPSRHISVDYLRTLGKVQIDHEKAILRDLSLCVGPMHLLVIPAKFGAPISSFESFSGKLASADPFCGETDLVNEEQCRGAIALLNRGAVTFPTKTYRAQKAGAAVAVVIQTGDVFPFVMEDTAGESAAAPIRIPVVMISKKDGEALRKLLAERERAGESLEATLKVGHAVSECSICQEAFEAGASVLKLPCRHLYHVDCVTNWLQLNHTCPLCRLELPKETEGKTLKRSADPRSADPSRNYYN